MRTRATVMVLALGVAGLSLAPPAGAQTPTTCLAEVDGGQYDDDEAFAGRTRSFADDEGTIVTRSLLCPYTAEDGRTTELILEWDERAFGRLGCENESLVVEPGDPTSGSVDHGVRQATVLLSGPDIQSVRAMDDAAAIALAAVPETAVLCSAGASDLPPASRRNPLPSVVVVGLVLAAATLPARRWHRRSAGPGAVGPGPRPQDQRPTAHPPDGHGPDADVDGSTSISPARLARRLLSDAGTGQLDLMASVSVISLLRGRSDLAAIAAAAHRSADTDRAMNRFGPRRRLARRILESAGGPADGPSGAPLDVGAGLEPRGENRTSER